MRRVCKIGGYVAPREPDWDTYVIHPHNATIERWQEVQAQLTRNEGAEPNAGRHLAEWAIEAGFPGSNIQLTSNVLQYFTTDERKWWGELWANAEFAQRAVSAGLAALEEIEQFAAAYRDWSESETGIRAMIQMRLLCQK